MAEHTERELIARVRQRLAPPPAWLLVGIGDDAAVVEPERNRVDVVTVDAVVEGVHFDRRFTPPGAIGHRALAVNLSDLASMGAQPRYAVLSMALPADLPVADFDGIVGGIAALAEQNGLHVIGGNLTRTPGPLTIDITVVGTAKRRQVLRRDGARAGDELYVTGTIGAAAAGLQMLRAGLREPGVCTTRYLYPEPRVRTGLLLARNRAATACMDLSDGLADAVRQVAEASGVGVELDEEALPLDAQTRDWMNAQGSDPVDAALRLGDDYELLVAVRPRQRGRLQAAIKHGGVPITRIGVCTKEPSLLVQSSNRVRTLPLGYSHFGR